MIMRSSVLSAGAIAAMTAILPFRAGAQSLLRSQFAAHQLKGEAIVQVQCASASQLFATIASDGTAKLWSQSGTAVHTYAPKPTAMLFNGRFLGNDNSGFITAAYNGTASAWSSPTAVPLKLGPHLSGVTDVQPISVAGVIVTASDDGSIRYWSATGKLLKRIEAPGVTRHLAYSPDLKLIAATQDIGSVTLLSPTGDLVGTVNTGQGRLNDVIFSTTQPLMLTGGFDGTIKIWHFSTANRLPRLQLTIGAQANAGWIEGLAINRDGVIASASDDGSIRFWNLQGTLLAEQNLSTNHHLMSVCMAADQRSVHVLAQDGTLSTLSLPQPR